MLFEQGLISDAEQILHDIEVDLGNGEYNPAKEYFIHLNQGCILYQKRQFEGSLQRFQQALQLLEITSPNVFNSKLVYNTALVHFELSQYQSAIQCLDRILANAYQSYPSLTQPQSELTTREILV
jgi:tetratricopeptide repeat protein 30